MSASFCWSFPLTLAFHCYIVCSNCYELPKQSISFFCLFLDLYLVLSTPYKLLRRKIWPCAWNCLRYIRNSQIFIWKSFEEKKGGLCRTWSGVNGHSSNLRLIALMCKAFVLKENWSFFFLSHLVRLLSFRGGSTFLSSKTSHKDVKDSTSWLLRAYYGHRLFMGYCCVGSEAKSHLLLLFLCSIYCTDHISRLFTKGNLNDSRFCTSYSSFFLGANQKVWLM